MSSVIQSVAGQNSLTDCFQLRRTADSTPERGRYQAEIDGRWSAPIFPHGGVLSALALRAMSDFLEVPTHTLRNSTTMFSSKVSEGTLEIDVEPIRRGKRMSQLRATLRTAGSEEPGHQLMAAFGESRSGFDLEPEAFLLDGKPIDGPDAYEPPPAPPIDAPAFRRGFFKETESRRVRLFSSFEEGWEGGRAEAIRWVRFRDPKIAIDEYALVALSDTMPPAIGQYLGPGFPVFHAPSVDLSFQMRALPVSEWILCRSRIRFGNDGYASGEMHLFDESRNLVGYATQLMLVRFPDANEFK